MKPSDFQKTVQCRFESCLKKVVRSVVKDYYKELNRRKNKESKRLNFRYDRKNPRLLSSSRSTLTIHI